MQVYLETSSYLPLIWTTPYSRSVIDLLEQRQSQKGVFLLQRDCIREASGYLSFKNDWRYHSAIRMRSLIEKIGNQGINKLPFPSTAMQLLLGGNIWPQAQYLNFVRHTAFFFVDLLDDITFEHPVDDLLIFADRIEQRIEEFRKKFDVHLQADSLLMPDPSILSYWGRWYLSAVPSRRFEIKIVDDVRPYDLSSDKLRDVYHYDCLLHANPIPSEMIVANTGFKKNVQKHFSSLSVPLVCATTTTSVFFG